MSGKTTAKPAGVLAEDVQDQVGPCDLVNQRFTCHINKNCVYFQGLSLYKYVQAVSNSYVSKGHYVHGHISFLYCIIITIIDNI